VELLKDRERFNPPIVTYVQTNSIFFDEEETERIKAIFDVSDVQNSDLAIMRSGEFFDMKAFSFKLVVEANDKTEALLGIQVDEFSRIVWKAVGMFKVAPIFWNLDKSYWPKMAQFMVGSVFAQPAQDTDIIIFRNSKGESIPCLVHIFASYDAQTKVRTAVSWCARPFSSRFCPPLMKFLVNKEHCHHLRIKEGKGD
jgi:hypothetical protein